MAYARWARDCPWYIFWSSAPTDAGGREGQNLSVWHVSRDPRSHAEFLYPQLVGIDEAKLAALMPWVPAADLPKAVECIREWLADVDKPPEEW